MRRRSATSSNAYTKFISGVGLVAVVGLVVFAGLSYGGYLDAQQIPGQRERAGLVKVPRSQKAIAALTKVTREDFHTLELGDDSYYWMEPARVAAHPEWILDPGDIVGRVMSHQKAPDLVFTKTDFLPEGSRTGLSGGVPENKQGFFVESSKIPGLGLLKMGDRFDLLAGLPEEAQGDQEAEFGLLAGGVKVRGGKPIPVSGVRLLVQDAQMVAITRGRDMTTQGVTNLPESSIRSRSQDGAAQITIAIDAEEVVPLTQALAAGRMIHCVAKSGRGPTKTGASGRAKIAGMIPFPATSRAVKAFTRLTAEDLADPDTGELRTYFFPPDKIQEAWIGSVTDLIGRVVARDISAGFIFSPGDLATGDALIKDVKKFQRLTSDDLADPKSASQFIGRVAAADFEAGTVVNELHLLAPNAAVMAIKAYQRIEPNHLADPISAKKLIGRVVSMDVVSGSAIDDSDLLPPDAASGISGGTPPGRMAISVDMAKVEGVSRLNRGDHFDLLATFPLKPGDAFTVLGTSVQFSGGVISQAELKDRARNELLAEGVVVVDVDETTATIAVRPNEVPRITKALTLGISVFALARSRQSGGAAKPQASTLKSDPNPVDRIRVIEEIVGDRRKVRVFATDKKPTD